MEHTRRLGGDRACASIEKLIYYFFFFFIIVFFFFQAEDGIRDHCVTGVQTCALPIGVVTGLLVGGDVVWLEGCEVPGVGSSQQLPF